MRRHILEHAQGFTNRADIVFRQRFGIGSRVGEDLVTLIQRLRQCQGGLGRETEAAVGLTLQAGQVKQGRRLLGGRLGFFGDDALLAGAVGNDLPSLVLIPDTLGSKVSVCRVAREGRVEPAAFVLACFCVETGFDFEVAAWLEFANALFAFDDDRKGRGLNTPDRGQKKPAVARIERGHGTGAIDADQPVGL